MKMVDILIFGTTVDEAWLNKDLVEKLLTDRAITYEVSRSKKQIIANFYNVYECVFRFVSPRVNLDGLAVKEFYLTSNLLKKGSKEEIEHCIDIGRSSYVKSLDVINEALDKLNK